MFKKSTVKKFSIAVASLALILPLASVGNPSASAKTKANRKQAVRVVKKTRRNNKNDKAFKHAHKSFAKRMDNNGNVHAHHYYKFAYNKKEYQKCMKFIRVYKKGAAKLNEEHRTSHKSYAYRTGFNDALYNVWHHKMVNNKQYEMGYIVGGAALDNNHVTKKDIQNGKKSYRFFKKMGPGTGPAIEQMKWEAHIDTF